MWTEEHRRIYRRDGDGYPSDLRDAEWLALRRLATQRVARSEAVVERALWSFRRCVTESIVTAAGPRSQASVRAAARKPALSKRGCPIFLDYMV